MRGRVGGVDAWPRRGGVPGAGPVWVEGRLGVDRLARTGRVQADDRPIQAHPAGRRGGRTPSGQGKVSQL